MDKEQYQKWQIQFRKGYLELCVLSLLQAKIKSYGLEILQSLEELGLEVNEGTLYPLLNRMQKNDWLKSEWETPSSSGHPRRFYSLTATSESLLPKMLEHYQQSHKIINSLLQVKK